MNAKKFKALLFLGWHFLVHFFKKIFPQAAGKEKFLDYYRPDRIFPISIQHRKPMPSYSLCITCRLCDTVCPEITENPTLTAPSFLVTSYSRSLTDHVHFAPQGYQCGICRACEKICPQNVPIRAIIDFMSNNANFLRQQA